MKVLEIKDISKEEGYIYYLNKYTGTAVLEILSRNVSIPVSFSVEMNPFGGKTVSIDPLPKELDYPVIPVNKALMEHIKVMLKQNSLP